MKIHILTFLACLFLVPVGAQNVGIGTNTPNTKAILEVESNSAGLLIPRLTTAQRIAINPGLTETGMIVFDRTLKEFMYYDGAGWTGMAGDTSLWKQSGSDIYYDDGKVGIGIDVPLSTLDIYTAENIGLRVRNDKEGDGPSYALQALNTIQGTGLKYGVLAQVVGDTNSTGKLYGVRSRVQTNDTGVDAYGGYFLVDSAGTGTHYGVYAKARGEGNFGIYAESENSEGYAAYLLGKTVVSARLGVGVDTPEYKVDIETAGKRGINLLTTSASSDTAYGVYNHVDDGGTGARFGIYSKVSPDDANAEKMYALFGTVDSTGTGKHIGVVGRALGDDNIGVQGRGAGTGIGVKGINEDNDGWAAYFEGNSYIQDRLEIRDKIFLRPVGNASGGEIELFDDIGQQTVTIRAGEATDEGAEIDLYDASGVRTVNLDGDRAGQGGALKLYDDDGDLTVKIHSAQSTSNGAEMLMYNDAGDLTIELDADWGSGQGRVITDELQITGGSDLAEHFDVAVHTDGPGTLVSIDPRGGGGLIPTSSAYDRSVAGVISGAGAVNPGMLMGQEGSIADGAVPVALVGRVYVKADASERAIRPGDLMTSSDLPGHAMSVRKHRKARGAIIGKALTGLDSGTGLVLILVNLQ